MVLATTSARRIKGARVADEQHNVGGAERALSVAAGGALAAYALRRRGVPGVALALLGAELVRRGASGHCTVYQALGITSTESGKVGALPHRPDVVGRAATVNARNAVKIERTVSVLRPAAELYRFWRDFANLPRFMQHLESVTCTDDRHSHWIARSPGGKHVEWDAEIINEIDGELIAWKTVGDSDVAHAGSVNFRAAPGNRGTEVKLVLDYEPPAAGLMGTIAKGFGHATDALIREELRRFKHVAEAGEIPTVEGQTACR